MAFDPALLAGLDDLSPDYQELTGALAYHYESDWEHHLSRFYSEVLLDLQEARLQLPREILSENTDKQERILILKARIQRLEEKRDEYEKELSEIRERLSEYQLKAAQPIAVDDSYGITQDLFDEVAENQPKKLLPIRHSNRDFFLADLVDTVLKDDNVTMEVPVYSLSTKPDLSTFKWVSKDGKRKLEITPSTLGRATMHDKDVLIYVTSQMTEALNRDRSDAKNRVVRFTVHDYLVTTNRHTSGREYQTFETALRRLSGTRIYTNIETGDIRIKRDFGLIDGWEIVEKSPTDERMIAVEITLSEWLFNAIQAREVLTLDPNYFRIRKPIERKVYEIARKHCGNQAQWKISLSLLHEKSGSRASIYEFHEAMKDIAKFNHLPQYKISLTSANRVADVMVTVHTRDAKRYIKSFLEDNKIG